MSNVRVTVLGCSGTMPGPQRACSSYLVESDGYRLLLDCGNGSLVNLQRCVGLDAVDAVILSHLHPDHFVDLYGLYYGLRFHPDGPLSVPVHAPAGAQEHLAQLLTGDPEDVFAKVCRFEDAAPGDTLRLGPMTVRLFAANHPIVTLASRVEVNGVVVAYTADSGTSSQLVSLARDADLLIADCSWLERQRPLPSGVHMTGAEAGGCASLAGAARLLVTHVFPTNDPEDVAAEAAQAFEGEIRIATDLQELHL